MNDRAQFHTCYRFQPWKRHFICANIIIQIARYFGNKWSQIEGASFSVRSGAKIKMNGSRSSLAFLSSNGRSSLLGFTLFRFLFFPPATLILPLLDLSLAKWSAKPLPPLLRITLAFICRLISLSLIKQIDRQRVDEQSSNNGQLCLAFCANMVNNF